MKFDPEKHRYSYRGAELTSATKFIDHFFPTFPRDKIAGFYAAKHGLEKEDVLQEWADKAKYASQLGTMVHDRIEQYINYLIEGYSRSDLMDYVTETIDELVQYDDARSDMFRAFLDFDMSYNLRWLHTEAKVYSVGWQLAGTVDAIARDSDGNLYIIDWKTNKSIDTYSPYNNWCPEPLSHLQDCNYNKYSLQLTLYSSLLKQTYGYDVDGAYIVHLQQNGFKLIPIQFLTRELATMLEHWT